MKKIYLITAAIFVTLISFAYPPAANLTITSTGTNKVKVLIDGRKIDMDRIDRGQYVVNNLSRGYHDVTVYVQKNTWGAQAPINNYKLVYRNRIYLKPQYSFDITINRFGRVFTDEEPIRNDIYTDDDRDEEYVDQDQYYNNQYDYYTPMSTQSFDQLKKILKAESFDDTKQSIAKQALKNNYVTTAQVKELLSYFTFEDNKLAMAKFAYGNTIDKRNYFTLSDIFVFNSNKEELMKYINNYKEN